MPVGVHQFDSHSRVDSEFEPGGLASLVVGNRGRLLDPRRTPVRIVALDMATGQFVVEIEAFEDQGARWQVPFEDCGRIYQFERGSATATPDAIAAFEAIVRELDRTTSIPCDPERAAATREQLGQLESDAGDWLELHSRFFAFRAALNLKTRRGPPALGMDLDAYMAAHDLADLETAFTAAFVSNPHSGDKVKGHRIVIAELGLVEYHGKAVRDPNVFEGAWSRERRARHILHRLAFVHAALRHAGLTTLTVYRGLAFDGPLAPRRNDTFVSSSLDLEVAMSCFAPRQVESGGVLMRQVVPVERVFMTFLETEAMNRQFLEAEVVLFHDEGNRLF